MHAPHDRRRTTGGALTAAALAAALAAAGAAPASAGAADGGFTQPRHAFDGFAGGAGATAPDGWQVTNENTDGMADSWAGWSFHTLDEVVDRWGTDLRQAFTRAHGTVAVVESDQNRPASGTFTSGLTSPSYPVEAGTTYELRFDSHYRQGGAGYGQTADVRVAFDTGETRTLLEYSNDADADNAGGTVESRREALAFTVPAGASSAQVTWSYRHSSNNWYWMLDNVELTEPMGEPAAGPVTTIDVLSDIQGSVGNRHLRDDALPLLNGLPDPADLLVVNGDITSNGSQAQYDAFQAAYDAAGGHVSGEMLPTIGNHEFYGYDGSDIYLQRFLDQFGLTEPWQERVVDGVPVLSIGSEGYDYAALTGSGPFVELSDEQFSWLTERLAYWREQGRPVLLFSHDVLPRSVSGTFASFYRNDFGADDERFQRLLLDHPNVVLFTSHTHWQLQRDDWAVEYRGTVGENTAERGVPVVNTGALTTAYTLSGDWGETGVAEETATGLRVSVYDDRVRVTSYDFLTGDTIDRVDLPVPAGGGADAPGRGHGGKPARPGPPDGSGRPGDLR